MEKEVELVDIPSDSESIDGICQLDDENEVHLPERQDWIEDSTSILQLDKIITEDDEDSGEDSKEDEMWGEDSQSKADIPFIKDFGPNIPEYAKSPLDVFLCLFPHELINLIVEQTNLYAKQMQSKQAPVTKDELFIFIGINILMGVKKLPSYRDYWSANTQLHDSYVASLMTVNRFGFFLSHLHINDNMKEPKREDPTYDKLYKLRPMLDKLGETYKNCWKPGKYQSVDESMIKFKGRSSMKQYMPQKPIKRGFKAWIRSDESGYVCEFQIYTGKTKNTEKQLGLRVVKDLTRDLIGGNHHVYFDNFFTSVDLLIYLKENQIFACGTVRKNRSRLPKNEKSDKKMGKGEYEFRTSNTGLRWIKWMDKKAVYFLSNYHDPSEATVVHRRQKDGSLLPIACPMVCADYNQHMGYVDYSDRLLSTYKIDRKSKKWWVRLFWYFVDLTIINSFIIYKEKNLQPSLTLKKFRLRLTEQLVGHKLSSLKGRKRVDSERDISSRKPQVNLEKRQSQSSHMPVYITSKRRCVQCSTNNNQVRCQWICKTCNVPLCLSSTKNCFLSYHK